MKVEIPKHSAYASETEALRTPKTPQNEGISWFESGSNKDPVQVYELALEADGGPNKDRAVSNLAFLLARTSKRIISEHDSDMSPNAFHTTN
jgi:glycogen debranching enzyme